MRSSNNTKQTRWVSFLRNWKNGDKNRQQRKAKTMWAFIYRVGTALWWIIVWLALLTLDFLNRLARISPRDFPDFSLTSLIFSLAVPLSSEDSIATHDVTRVCDDKEEILLFASKRDMIIQFVAKHLMNIFLSLLVFCVERGCERLSLSVRVKQPVICQMKLNLIARFVWRWKKGQNWGWNLKSEIIDLNEWIAW